MDAESVSIRNIQREIDKLEYENKGSRDKIVELNNTIEVLSKRIITYEREIANHEDTIYKKERQLKEESQKTEILQSRIDDLQKTAFKEVEELQTTLQAEKKKYVEQVKKSQQDMDKFRLEVEENLPRLVYSTNKSLESEIQQKYEKDQIMTKTMYLNELETLRKEILFNRSVIQEKDSLLKLNTNEYSIDLENLKLQVGFLVQRRDQMDLENRRLLHALQAAQQQLQGYNGNGNSNMYPQPQQQPPYGFNNNNNNYSSGTGPNMSMYPPPPSSEQQQQSQYQQYPMSMNDDYMKAFYPPAPAVNANVGSRYVSPARNMNMSNTQPSYYPQQLFSTQTSYNTNSYMRPSHTAAPSFMSATVKDHTMAIVQSQILSLRHQLHSTLGNTNTSGTGSSSYKQQQRQYNNDPVLSAMDRYSEDYNNTMTLSPIFNNNNRNRYTTNTNTTTSNMSTLGNTNNFSHTATDRVTGGSTNDGDDDYRDPSSSSQQQLQQQSEPPTSMSPAQWRETMREKRIQEAIESFDREMMSAVPSNTNNNNNNNNNTNPVTTGKQTRSGWY